MWQCRLPENISRRCIWRNRLRRRIISCPCFENYFVLGFDCTGYKIYARYPESRNRVKKYNVDK